ncbi:hypothetical protein GQ44DRAFT_697456 [Phaeosphaeriaceae sp. PMI808]|nr:hypothetical protein GQ44DRAFT_697456 [Phaeosphaeriaceae sp. PMI808]
MLFNTQTVAILASISALVNALPLETNPRYIVPRQKNYSVINVDGGPSQGVPATTVIKPTKTIEVVNPGPIVTQEVTTTVAQIAPAPTPTSSSSKSTKSAPSSTTTTSSSNLTPTQTPKSIFVTVTLPKDDGPAEYYDNGLWHTNYRIKTFDAPVATVVPSASGSTISSQATATSA